jgi:hypothetical protein
MCLPRGLVIHCLRHTMTTGLENSGEQDESHAVAVGCGAAGRGDCPRFLFGRRWPRTSLNNAAAIEGRGRHRPARRHSQSCPPPAYSARLQSVRCVTG